MNPSTFLAEFSHIAQAPGGVQRLREMILQLAVQGKLVEQDPGDEHASELLKRIVFKIAALKQSGVLRYKQTESGTIKKEVLYEVPNNWKWCRFGEIWQLVSGRDLPPSQYSSIRNGIPYITGASNINGNSFIINRWTNNPTVISIREDLLISCKGTIGKVIFNNFGDAHIARQIMAIRNCSMLLDQYFLKIWLESYVVELLKKSKSMIPGFSREDLLYAYFPLPPLAEQQRIVAKVEQLMSLCDQLDTQQNQRRQVLNQTRQTVLESLAAAPAGPELRTAWNRVEANLGLLFETPEDVEDLKKCLLQNAVMGKLVPQNPADEPAAVLLQTIQAEKAEMIKRGEIKKDKPLPSIREDEKPFAIPVGWEWCRLGDIGELARGKSKHRPRNDMKLYLNGTIPLVQTGDVAQSNGLIKTYTALYNDFGLAQSRLWPKGTLCITIAANIADTGLLTFEACFPDSVVGFLLVNKALDINYFEYFIRTAKERLNEFAPATAQKNINLDILGKVLVPLPPINELHNIVAKVQSLLALCDTLQSQIAAARKVASLLAQAALETLTGISMEKPTTMKIPKTELVSKLILAKHPEATAQAPLSALLSRHNDELSAKALWNHSGLPIDEFYRQLKTEMVAGWIVEPHKAEVRTIQD